MSNTITRPDRREPSEPNGGGSFSGIIDSITRRTSAIQDTQNAVTNTSFIEEHLAPLDTLLAQARIGGSPRQLFDISNQYRQHLADTIYELQKITYDRDRIEDLFALSIAISGDRG